MSRKTNKMLCKIFLLGSFLGLMNEKLSGASGADAKDVQSTASGEEPYEQTADDFIFFISIRKDYNDK
jgi:hypothetical protein